MKPSAAKMPATVHLGPFIYRVTEASEDWAALDRDDRDNSYGYTLHTTATIYVQPDLEPMFKRVVLLHEILHVAAFASGAINDNKRSEEQWVVMAAPPLMDALRRSPGLVEWLMEA